MTKLSVWDIIAWIVLIGILIWILLKIFNVINTPVLIEYAPYFGAVYLAGWQIHKLSMVAKEVEGLKKFRSMTIKKINDIGGNFKINHQKIK